MVLDGVEFCALAIRAHRRLRGPQSVQPLLRTASVGPNVCSDARMPARRSSWVPCQDSWNRSRGSRTPSPIPGEVRRHLAGPARSCMMSVGRSSSRYWLSWKRRPKLTIPGLVSRILATGMCQFACARMDRWAEGDLANQRSVGPPRLARVLVRQPDEQLGPNR